MKKTLLIASVIAAFSAPAFAKCMNVSDSIASYCLKTSSQKATPPKADQTAKEKERRLPKFLKSKDPRTQRIMMDALFGRAY